MKRTAAWVLASTLLAAPLALPVTPLQAAPPQPQAPAPAAPGKNEPQSAKIDAAREKAERLYEALSKDPSVPEILEIIAKNLTEVQGITDQLKAADDVDAVINDVSRRFDTIADSFGRVADISRGVFERRFEQLRDLSAIEREVGFNMADVKNRVRAMQQGNGKLAERVRTGELSGAELNNARTDLKANEVVIRTLQASIEVWNTFGDEHARLTEKLDKHSSVLNSFLHTLKRNADVYRSVAEILRLRKSLAAITTEFRSLERLNDHVDELEKSWQSLDQAIDKLRKQPFARPTPPSS